MLRTNLKPGARSKAVQTASKQAWTMQNGQDGLLVLNLYNVVNFVLVSGGYDEPAFEKKTFQTDYRW